MRQFVDLLYWSVGVLAVAAIVAVTVFYLAMPDGDMGPFGLFYVAGMSLLIWCMIIGVVCSIARCAYLTFKKDKQ